MPFKPERILERLPRAATPPEQPLSNLTLPTALRKLRRVVLTSNDNSPLVNNIASALQRLYTQLAIEKHDREQMELALTNKRNSRKRRKVSVEQLRKDNSSAAIFLSLLKIQKLRAQRDANTKRLLLQKENKKAEAQERAFKKAQYRAKV